jgi:hypothetical protein
MSRMLLPASSSTASARMSKSWLPCSRCAPPLRGSSRPSSARQQRKGSSVSVACEQAAGGGRRA